ncbi:MAG: LytTR family DNA-binding domain-containing protein [Bacteroidetes bacterium]|nr:LytTR family DNA-binding domain-containing protein [Bacteroidota bacterium]MCL1968432.1 LytTR family DNA-binding domain-containing protein [Bacteroidota bacterium]
MERYKYIIIDDEYPLHLTVQHHFNAFPNYECAATFLNPKQALLFLQTHKIDLIFLDIEMQEINGFQFLEDLQKKIFVVILTAYPNKYSLEAHNYYDKDLVFFTNKAQLSYYFSKIIKRFETMYADKETLNRVTQLSTNEITTFPHKINNQLILLADIKFIIVAGHHIILNMKDKEELVFRMTLRELILLLPPNNFFQIKRNMVINIGYVTSFTETTVCIENQHFIISYRNRQTIVQELKNKKDILYKNC